MQEITLSLLELMLLLLSLVLVFSYTEVTVAKKYDLPRNRSGKGPHWLGPFGYYYHHIPESFVFFLFGMFLAAVALVDILAPYIPYFVTLIAIWIVVLAFSSSFARRVLRFFNLSSEELLPDPIKARLSTILLLLFCLGLGYWFGRYSF